MTRGRVIFNWILTIVIGSFMSAQYEVAEHGSGLFSVLELAVMIAGFAALAGTLPLVISLLFVSLKSELKQLIQVLVLLGVQFVFTILFCASFYATSDHDFVNFTLIFFVIGMLLTLLSLLKKKDLKSGT